MSHDDDGMTDSAESSTPASILDVRGLSKTYGGVHALNNLSITVERGLLYGIIGPNGSGKTTLINMLSGALRADAGSAWFQGVDLVSMGGRADMVARLGISRSFQGIRYVPDATVLQNIELGTHRLSEAGLLASLLNTPRAAQEARSAREAAIALGSRLGLEAVHYARARSLPYGTQRKMELARALASRPVLLLLDEPTSGMTPVETRDVFELFRLWCADGLTIVVVEHDLDAMSRYCDRLAVLDHGLLIAEGEPKDALATSHVIEAYVGRSASH